MAAATRGRPLKKDKLGDADWKALVKSGGVLDEQGATWYPSRDVMTGRQTGRRLAQGEFAEPRRL